MKRLLRPHFTAQKARLKRWPKRRGPGRCKNPLLSLLASDVATMRGLALRSGLSIVSCYRTLHGRTKPSADTAQRLARSLNLSTDQFIDILREYAPKRRAASKSAVSPSEPKS